MNYVTRFILRTAWGRNRAQQRALAAVRYPRRILLDEMTQVLQRKESVTDEVAQSIL